MIILHVIDGISRNSGGPSRSAQGLVAGLNRAGVETWLMTLRQGEEPWIEGVTKFANGEPFEQVAVRVKPDIVHLHGIWGLDMHRCAVCCRRLGIPYVIAPRGMLEPWSLGQKKWKKRLARWLYQDRDLKMAAALHATAESEAEQFRKLGFKNPIIISPNGVNVPTHTLPLHPTPTTKRALFVSRMHPKKGVLELVEAWGRLGVGSEGVREWECELVYTVSGEFEKAYEAKVIAKVQELGLADRFIFTGALNDEEKWQAYARADLFVLPTYSENFGIVVAEALWAKVPVITTQGTPWKDLEDHQCGWWIDIGVEPLIKALIEAMALSPDELQAMGERGRKLVEEKYTWDAVVKNMVKGYGEVLNART
jgi:glycosyltransferase involved in cell wall biosynthesis